MSTTITPTRDRTRPAARGRLTAGGILASEWIKIRTVRSTIWCFGILILLIVGIGMLIATLTEVGDQSFDADTSRSLSVLIGTAGVNVAVLIAAVLGALIITGEYSTGMIRSTFTAVPRRTGAVLAKIVVLTVTTFVATEVGVWLAVLATAPILSGRGVEVQLGHPSVVMPLLGAGVYVALIALLAFAVGAILRSTAGALATVLGLILVAPVVLAILAGLTNAEWIATVNSLLPQNAGAQLYQYAPSIDVPVPVGPDGQEPPRATGVILNGWGGFGVLAAWNAVVLALAFVLVKRRDA